MRREANETDAQVEAQRKAANVAALAIDTMSPTTEALAGALDVARIAGLADAVDNAARMASIDSTATPGRSTIAHCNEMIESDDPARHNLARAAGNHRRAVAEGKVSEGEQHHLRALHRLAANAAQRPTQPPKASALSAAIAEATKSAAGHGPMHLSDEGTLVTRGGADSYAKALHERGRAGAGDRREAPTLDDAALTVARAAQGIDLSKPAGSLHALVRNRLLVHHGLDAQAQRENAARHIATAARNATQIGRGRGQTARDAVNALLERIGAAQPVANTPIETATTTTITTVQREELRTPAWRTVRRSLECARTALHTPGITPGAAPTRAIGTQRLTRIARAITAVAMHAVPANARGYGERASYAASVAAESAIAGVTHSRSARARHAPQGPNQGPSI